YTTPLRFNRGLKRSQPPQTPAKSHHSGQHDHYPKGSLKASTK
ncbi:hypothetical protein L195_g013678, partial [Trifolium pratense]